MPMFTQIEPWNTCGELEGIKLYFSDTAMAFLVALLDPENEEIWNHIQPESKELIKEFGKLIARDIKVAIMSQEVIIREAEGEEDKEKKVKMTKETLESLQSFFEDMIKNDNSRMN